jgi:hypothetical protein
MRSILGFEVEKVQAFTMFFSKRGLGPMRKSWQHHTRIALPADG